MCYSCFFIGVKVCLFWIFLFAHIAGLKLLRSFCGLAILDAGVNIIYFFYFIFFETFLFETVGLFRVLVLGSLQLYCNRRTVGWILVLPSFLAGFRYVLSVIETNLVHHSFLTYIIFFSHCASVMASAL